MGRSQREKGKRIERAAASLLKGCGYEARRSVQYCGRAEDSADLIHSIPGVRLEIKGGYNEADLTGETVSDWMTKLVGECQPGEKPLILWKRDRKDWLALIQVPVVGLVATANVPEAIAYLAGGES